MTAAELLELLARLPPETEVGVCYDSHGCRGSRIEQVHQSPDGVDLCATHGDHPVLGPWPDLHDTRDEDTTTIWVHRDYWLPGA